jgi:hypothetical protein
MTDQNSFPSPDSSQTPPPASSEGVIQRWIPGLILIGLGIAFLLGNLTGFELHNWWAVFILIPAVGALARGFDRYRQVGRMDEHVVQALLSGIILVGVAMIFLFNLSWTLFGPVILILIGLSLLGREWLRK